MKRNINSTIKTENKKTIRYEAIQGQILKKFKDKEGFIENVELSRSTFYFKLDFTNVPSSKELKFIIALF